MRVRSEVVVGLVVIVAAILLYWGHSVLRMYGVGQAGYQIDVYFWTVSPLLSDGSPVRLSGVNVGKVLSRTEVSPPADMPPPEEGPPLEQAVRVRCLIARKTRIKADYQITIREPSVLVGLGEAFVDIKPTSGGAREGHLRDGDHVFGRKPLTATDMADQLNTSVIRLNETLTEYKGMAGDIRAIVGDPHTRENLIAASANIRRITEEFSTVSQVAAQVATARRRDLETAISNMAQLSGRLNRSAAAIEEVVTDRAVREDFRTTLSEMRESSENIRKATAHIEQVVSDPQNTENFQSALQSIRSASGNLDRIAQNASEVMGTEEGRNRLKETFDAAQEAIENIRRISGEVQEVTGNAANRENLEASLASIRSASENIARSAERIDQLLADGTVTTRVREIVENVDRSAQSLREVSQEVHRLVVETDTTQKLEEAVSTAREAVERINQVAADVQSLTGDTQLRENVRQSMENIRDITDRTRSMVGKAEDTTRLRVDVSEELAYSPRIGRSINVVDIDVDRGEQATGLILGFYDVGFANSVKLQVSTRLADRIRGNWGVYKGFPGIGSYYQSGKYKFGFDLYNPNSIRLDWNSYYMITDDLRFSSRMEEVGVENRPLWGLGWVF